MFGILAFAAKGDQHAAQTPGTLDGTLLAGRADLFADMFLFPS